MGAAPPDAWLVSDRSRAALRSLPRVLDSAIAASDVQFGVMAQHLVRRGGKRLRPALVLLAGEFGAFPVARLLRGAAALELVHVASLYHDDIVDRAPSRRGVSSANAAWGNAAAALAGTFLFSRAARAFAGLGDEANRLASRAVSEVCAGELAEVENAYDVGLDVEVHLDILRRKTAALFELPCVLGARLARADDGEADALARFGRHLGLAFQLADDALDLVGDPDELGKPAGADLRKGVYSLAVLRAIAGHGEMRDRLVSTLAVAEASDDELSTAREAVVTLGGVDAALEFARQEQRLARVALATLPPSPARTSLDNLAVLALSRSS